MIRRWEPIFRAINPKTGDLSTYSAPVIEAPSAALAQEWCNKNNMAHCTVGIYDEVYIDGVRNNEGKLTGIDYHKIRQQ